MPEENKNAMVETLEIDGVNYSVTPEFKKAHQEFIDGMKKSKSDDDDLDFISNPKVALRRELETWGKTFAEKIKTEVTTELTAGYKAEETKKEFWNTFYKENEDLKNDDFLVKAILARDWDELGKKTGSEVNKELADRTRKALLTYSGKKEKAKPVHVEAPSNVLSFESAPEPEKTMSIGDMLKANNAARRKK